MKNIFSINLGKLKSKGLQCLFQVSLHSLEDFMISSTSGKRGTSLAESIIDLLQYKYSISWRCGKRKGNTEIKSIRSTFCEDFEDYNFIEQNAGKAGKNGPTSSSQRRRSAQIRNSRKLVYVIDFDYAVDFLTEMKIDTGEGVMTPRVQDKLLTLEIREHNNSGDIKTVGNITANLVDFTTPPNQVGSLKRTCLFPVRLVNDKKAKLRVTISSIWLKNQTSPSRNPEEKKYDEYFVVEEDEQILVTPAPKRGTMTPRVAATGSKIQPVASGLDKRKSVVVSKVTGKPPLHDGSAESSMMSPSPPTLSPRSPRSDAPITSKTSAGEIQMTPRTEARSAFNVEASHFVSQLRHLKTEIQKLEAEKREIEEKLRQQQPTGHVPHKKLLTEIFNRVDTFQNSAKHVKDTVDIVQKKIEHVVSRLELIENEKAGYPKFVKSFAGSSTAEKVTVVYIDISAGGRLWELSQEKMIEAFDIYDEAVRECLKLCTGYEIDTNGEGSSDSDAVMCCFSSAKMAIRFCLMLQLKLMEADWPEELLELKGMVIPSLTSQQAVPESSQQQIFRGIRCRMGVDCGKLNSDIGCHYDSQLKRYIYFGNTIKKASIIASYALGGHIMVSDQVFQELKTEAPLDSSLPTIKSIVQPLGEHSLAGLEQKEPLYLFVPEKLKGREFSTTKNLTLAVNQSFVVNKLHQELEFMRVNGLDSFQVKITDLEEQLIVLNMLTHLYAEVVAEDDKEKAACSSVTAESSEKSNSTSSSPMSSPKHSPVMAPEVAVKVSPVPPLNYTGELLPSPRAASASSDSSTPHTPKSAREKAHLILLEKQKKFIQELEAQKAKSAQLEQKMQIIESELQELSLDLLEPHMSKIENAIGTLSSSPPVLGSSPVLSSSPMRNGDENSTLNRFFFGLKIKQMEKEIERLKHEHDKHLEEKEHEIKHLLMENSNLRKQNQELVHDLASIKPASPHSSADHETVVLRQGAAKSAESNHILQMIKQQNEMLKKKLEHYKK